MNSIIAWVPSFVSMRNWTRNKVDRISITLGLLRLLPTATKTGDLAENQQRKEARI